MNNRFVGAALVLPLAVYLFFALSFAFLNAPGNAPDEPAHVAYARYMAASGKIPVFEQSAYWPRYTAFHPPFYYWTLAKIYRHISGRPVDFQFRILRMASVLFHFLALLAVGLIAFFVFSNSKIAAAGTMACLALNPMFTYLGGSVINDTLANFAMVAVVLVGVWTLKERRGAPGALLLGLATGLACGSKMSAVFPALGVWLFLKMARRLTVKEWAIAALTVSLIAGPIFLRNMIYYGDPFAAAAIYKTEPHPAGFSGLIPWMISSYESFWAVFGWMMIRLPEWFYKVLWLIGALAASGLAATAALSWRKNQPAGNFSFRSFLDRQPMWTLMVLVSAIVLAQGAWYGITSLQRQGRYLYVGLGAFAPLFYLGLKFWVDRVPARFVRSAVWCLLIAFGILMEWKSLAATTDYAAVFPGVYNFKGLQ